MHRLIAVIVLMLLSGTVAGCSSGPPARIDAYLGPIPGKGVAVSEPGILPAGGLEAGLLIVNDTTAPRSAPSLSENALIFLTDQVQEQVQRALPIRLVKVLPSAGISPAGDPEPFVRLAREQGLEYLLLAIFSSQESEVPTYLPVNAPVEQGGTRPQVPGFTANNYALAELALLNAKTGETVLKANGQAWASLDRLYVPMSNAYPVIHRALQIAPIFPREKDAKDVLRSIAARDALEQAVQDLNRGRKKVVSATALPAFSACPACPAS
ncbi:MAG: hypothetical protein C4293_17250 [Nitrospiraceae bacterium]